MKNSPIFLLVLLGLTACGGGGGSPGTCMGSSDVCFGKSGSATQLSTETTTTVPTTTATTGANSNQSVARYAGTWTADFSGDDSGSCAEIIVNTSGTATGTCSTTTIFEFSISGAIDAAGNANFKGSNGVSFTGVATSDTTASGSWFISANGAQGTWRAKRK